MADVKLSGLTKVFGEHRAVDDVSLTIAEGEFFSLLGPSGCGKSTTLRMIAGFEETDAGIIEIGGSDVSSFPPEQREIGFVFQNYAIFPHMNVYDNIAFGLRLRKQSREEIDRRVKSALQQVGMTGLENRFQREMSGGQQQRVALARVLVTEPRILLLDEPLSALDKNLREEMKFWIKDLQVSLGITTIYVTHDQGEALTMSDRIAVMNDGRVAQIGSPKEIYEQPSDRFITEFIGESNLLVAKIVSTNGSASRVDIHGQSFDVPHQDGLVPGDDALLVLRPERIILGATDTEDGWNHVKATVRKIMYQGSLMRFLLELNGEDLIVEIANRHDTPKPDLGSMVPLSWKIESGWLIRK